MSGASKVAHARVYPRLGLGGLAVCCVGAFFAARLVSNLNRPAAEAAAGTQPAEAAVNQPAAAAVNQPAAAAVNQPAAAGRDSVATNDRPAVAATPAYTTESLRGQVVYVAEALERHFGIETDADARQTLVGLETASGQIHPLVKDFRGRAFYQDERLRGIALELLVRRFTGSPLVQVVRVHTVHDDQLFELDYWCDVCAIPMYELKECECCQGPIRLRERPVESAK